MSEIHTKMPKFSTREVVVDVPDAVVDWFTREKLNEARERALVAARAASDKGMGIGGQISSISSQDLARTAARAKLAATPVIQKGANAAAQAASEAGRQAGPMLANLQRGATQVAGTLSESAPKAVAAAQERGAEVVGRARDEWVPATRERVRQAQPVIGGAVRGRATSMGRSAALAGYSTRYGAKVARKSFGRSVQDATNTTKRVTSDFFGLVFWLGIVAWLLLLVFVPDKGQRQQLYRRAQAFISGWVG